jgi:hypothetical protein
MMGPVRESVVAAAWALLLVVVVPASAASASCTGSLGPGEHCDDTIEERPTSGWLLIPLGMGIGGVAAAAYLAVEHRSRSHQASRS